jgi:hypothetical protein
MFCPCLWRRNTNNTDEDSASSISSGNNVVDDVSNNIGSANISEDGRHDYQIMSSSNTSISDQTTTDRSNNVDSASSISSNNVDDTSNNISTSSNGTIINRIDINRIEESRHILRELCTENKSNIVISNRQHQQYHLVLAELKKKFEKKQSRLLMRVDTTEDGDDSEEISENKKKCTSCELNIDVISTQTSNTDTNNNNNQTGTIDICFSTMDSLLKHDEALFKQPPTNEDCSICFDRMPSLASGYSYMTCCGKEICTGCLYAPVYDNRGNKVDNKKCPFCRSPWIASDDEYIERLQKRVEAGDPIAMNKLGRCYLYEMFGLAQDYTKALELYHQAAELGCANACTSIGHAYNTGIGVEVDNKKVRHYYELGAMGGDVKARWYLGAMEYRVDRALKHYLIAVRDGDDDSLKCIKRLYSDGHVPKYEYTKALRLHQEYLSEIKSTRRDEATVAYHRYY